MVKISVGYERPLIPKRTKSCLNREKHPLYKSSSYAYAKILSLGLFVYEILQCHQTKGLYSSEFKPYLYNTSGMLIFVQTSRDQMSHNHVSSNILPPASFYEPRGSSEINLKTDYMKISGKKF